MNVNKKTKICISIGMCAMFCSSLISKPITNDKKVYNVTGKPIINNDSKVESVGVINNELANKLISVDTSQFDYDESRNIYKLTKDIDSISGNIQGEVEDISSLTYSVTNEKEIVVKEGTIVPTEEWSISDIGFVLGKNNLTITAETNEGKITNTIVIYNESYGNISNLNVDVSDNDNDGLINYWEDYFGTDKNNSDSDEDGVSDFDEITKLGTDPLKADTSGNGINDGDEDFDEDGISNKEEIKYGTNPYMSDSDSDLISDYDEIYKYKTNAIIADTDGDGAIDGWEVTNGCDPLSKDEYFTIDVISNDEKAKLSCDTVKGTDIENFNLYVSKESILKDIVGAKTEVYDLSYNSETQISIEYKVESEYENPLIYEYDKETQELIALDTCINDTYLTAKTSGNKNFSYIVIDQNEYESGMVQACCYDFDDGTDSNNDGITDIDTFKMCTGELLTNFGTKVFGDATYDEIQANDDYDEDEIKNGDEITIKTNNLGKRYVLLKSSPATYDTDNDGINDYNDTAPLTRGLKDGVIGSVQIYSRHNPEEAFFLGHAFLVYTSYVNDETLVIKDINKSYLYDKGNDTYVLKDGDFDSYTLQRGEHVSIGNYRPQGLDVVYDTTTKDYEALWVDSGLSEYLDKDNLTMEELEKFATSKEGTDLIDKNFQSFSGPSIRFNEEIYDTYAYENFVQYPNAVLTKEVTKDQLDKITGFAESHNHYNLLVNNCSTIASGAWNAAFNDNLLQREESGLYSTIDTPMILKKNMFEREGVEADVKTFGIVLN